MSGRTGLSIGLGVVGAVAGSFLGSPEIGYALGSLAGGIIGQAAFPEDGPTYYGARLKDLQGQTSEYGKPIPTVYGVARIAGNVVWAAPIREHTHKQSVGGKGFGGGPTGTRISYTYTASYASMLCAGPIVSVRKLWLDTSLVYDVSDRDSPTVLYAGQHLTDHITIYPGTEDQQPSPLQEAYEGAGRVPAYRGRVIVEVEDLELSDYGNRRPNIRAEIVTAADTVGLREVNRYDTPLDLKYGTAKPAAAFDQGTVLAANGKEPDKPGGYKDPNRPQGKDFRFDLTGNVLGVSHYDYGDVLVHLHQGEPGFIGKKGWAEGIGVNYAGGRGQHRAPYYVVRNRYYTDRHGGTESYFEAFRGNKFLLRTDRLVASSDTLYALYQPGGGGRTRLYDQAQDRTVTLDLRINPLQSCIESGGDYIWHAPYGYSYLQLLERRGDYRFVEVARIDSDRVGHTNLILVAEHGLCIAINYQLNQWTVWSRVPAVRPKAVPLSEIVADLCARAGLGPGDIDTSDLADVDVTGYVRTSVQSARSAIDPLRTAYFFDAVESDDRLKFVKRGAAPALTLTPDELGASAAGGAGRDEGTVEVTRTPDRELPRTLEIQYMDADANYETGSQSAGRLITEALGTRSIALPLVLDADRARRIAQTVLHDDWLARQHYQGATWTPHAGLEPTDVIRVAGDGADYRWRLTEVSFAPPGLISLKAVSDETGVYRFDDIGQTGGNRVAHVSDVVGPSNLSLIDSPLLRDSDDDPGFYVSLSGFTANWRGGGLFRSTDGGASFDEVLLVSAGETVGSVEAALAAGPHTIWDGASTCTVRVLAGATLAGTSEAAVLAGANAALVGTPGRWEVIAFARAELQSDGTYRLSRLLRGLRGTESNITRHADNERFVLLSANTLRRLDFGLSDLGLERLYEAVSYGLSSSATPASFVNTGRGLAPYAPVHARAEKTPDGGVRIEWVRRTRIGGAWRDGTGVPLGEASERYEVDIRDADARVLRTLHASAPAALYSLDFQTFDFGGQIDTVRARIYQVSDTVGRGEPAALTAALPLVAFDAAGEPAGATPPARVKTIPFRDAAKVIYYYVDARYYARPAAAGPARAYDTSDLGHWHANAAGPGPIATVARRTGRYVGVGGVRIQESDDLVHWSSQYDVNADNVDTRYVAAGDFDFEVTYDGTRFVIAMGASGAILIAEPNTAPLRWYARQPFPLASRPRKVISSGARYAALVGEIDGADADGRTRYTNRLWVTAKNELYDFTRVWGDRPVHDVIWDGARFVAPAETPDGTGAVYTSPDGAADNWSLAQTFAARAPTSACRTSAGVILTGRVVPGSSVFYRPSQGGWTLDRTIPDSQPKVLLSGGRNGAGRILYDAQKATPVPDGERIIYETTHHYREAYV